MTQVTVSNGLLASLPPALRTAQDAIALPEVQAMLKKLADYNLGICMPHMHCETTGRFQVLPDDMLQIEDGLEVFFETVDNIKARSNPMVPVAWAWRDGLSAMSMCYSYCQSESDDEEGTTAMHKIKHRKQD
jgi:hypothetical protein